MGSLMAGWDSHTMDPKLVTLKKNRSHTKEEIAAYWQTKKEIEEEHLRAVVSNLSQTTKVSKNNENKCEKSIEVPLALDAGVDTNLEELIKKNDWWTKSSWAFLNEPPVMEAVSNKYASQFHVAKLGSSKFNAGDGISA